MLRAGSVKTPWIKTTMICTRLYTVIIVEKWIAIQGYKGENDAGALEEEFKERELSSCSMPEAGHTHSTRHGVQ